MTPEQLPLPCRHHWRIAEPNGPTSAGRCTVCLEVRQFGNSDPADRDWSLTRDRQQTMIPFALKGSIPRRRGKPLRVATGRERTFTQHWEGPL